MRSIRAAITAALATAALVFTAAPPAQAAVVHGCNEDSICLYQALNYGQEKWQSSLLNIYNHTNHCLNISPASWTNGTPVNDNSGSLVLNNNKATSPFIHYTIRVHNYVNCPTNGGVRLFTGPEVHQLSDLRQWYYNGSSIPMYHAITSISVRVS